MIFTTLSILVTCNMLKFWGIWQCNDCDDPNAFKFQRPVLCYFTRVVLATVTVLMAQHSSCTTVLATEASLQAEVCQCEHGDIRSIHALPVKLYKMQ